jgi:hypothetical protein
MPHRITGRAQDADIETMSANGGAQRAFLRHENIFARHEEKDGLGRIAKSSPSGLRSGGQPYEENTGYAVARVVLEFHTLGSLD